MNGQTVCVGPVCLHFRQAFQDMLGPVLIAILDNPARRGTSRCAKTVKSAGKRSSKVDNLFAPQAFFVASFVELARDSLCNSKAVVN